MIQNKEIEGYNEMDRHICINNAILAKARPEDMAIYLLCAAFLPSLGQPSGEECNISDELIASWTLSRPNGKPEAKIGDHHAASISGQQS